MSSLIVRIFDNYGDALDAANELRKSRFGSSAITLISTARNPEPDEPLDPAATLEKVGIPAADLGAFTSVVIHGKSVLAVRAVFGAAAKAINIMKRHNPIAAGIGWKEYDMTNIGNKTTSDSAAPLSSALGWPLLLSDAAPFSRFWKWPTLLNNPAPLSSWLNFPTLWRGYTFGEPKPRSGYTFGEPKLRSGYTFGEPKLRGGYTLGEPELRGGSEGGGYTFGEPTLLGSAPAASEKPKE